MQPSPMGFCNGGGIGSIRGRKSILKEIGFELGPAVHVGVRQAKKTRGQLQAEYKACAQGRYWKLLRNEEMKLSTDVLITYHWDICKLCLFGLRSVLKYLAIVSVIAHCLRWIDIQFYTICFQPAQEEVISPPTSFPHNLESNKAERSVFAKISYALSL